MADLTNIFQGPFSIKEEAFVASPEDQFRNAMFDAGLEPPETIRLDGRIHRFKSGTKGPSGRGDKTGWYIGFLDGIPAGRFGCWRADIELPWKANMGRQLTSQEEIAITRRMEESRAARDAELERSHEIATIVVERIWSEGLAASPDHPYLQRKNIQPNGARVTGDGRLMVPLFGDDGELKSLQYIDVDGGKRYHSGGQTGGSFWVLGDLDQGKTIYIAEGYATAATIHEVSGCPCVVAYSATNLIPVTGAIKKLFGASRDLLIVADNDQSDVGLRAAEQASAKHGVRYVIPPIKGDANDYVAAGHDLMTVLNPPRDSSWLVAADEFCQEPTPIKWMLKNWIPEESLIMVHGPSGCGKSFFVIDACAHIAAQKPEWLGHKAKEGCVVYLAGEGHHGMRGRLAAWKNHHKARSLNMYISKEGLDLNTPEGYQRVVDALSQLPEKPTVIVVDTLNRFLMGDENSAEDTKTMLDACNSLMRLYGCSVLIVHHTGVAEGAQHRARGSSAWRGALDIEISIVGAADGKPMEVIQRKNKDAELAETMYVKLEQVIIPGWFDEDGMQVTSAVVVPAEAAPKREKIDSKVHDACVVFRNAFAYVKGGDVRDGFPYITRSALADYIVTEMGHSPNTANKHCAPNGDITCGPLVRAGLIKKDGDGFIVTGEPLKGHVIGGLAADSLLAPKEEPKIRIDQYDD